MNTINAVSNTPITKTPKNGRLSPLWTITAVLCVVIALVSSRYLFGVGPMPDDVAANSLRHPWLLLHIAFAVLALLVSPFQFLNRVRALMPRMHRYLGRIYAVGCITGGLSGFMLALGSSTGPVSSVGFGLLAVGWVYTTAAGWYHAMQRQFGEHRKWMIRSFALTLAAVTLRLYLPLLAILPVTFAAGYQAISFLCWVPNLFIAEAYLRRQTGRVTA